MARKKIGVRLDVKNITVIMIVKIHVYCFFHLPKIAVGISEIVEAIVSPVTPIY
jgi:hypothetical protein